MAAKRSVRFEFDEFGRSMLEVASRRTGLPVGDLLCQAARRCVRDAGRAVPRLRRLTPLRPENEVSATLELGAGEWEAIEEEADRQRVSVERLLEHATIDMLADLDGSADLSPS
jgi:hypothetical protein